MYRMLEMLRWPMHDLVVEPVARVEVRTHWTGCNAGGPSLHAGFENAEVRHGARDEVRGRKSLRFH